MYVDIWTNKITKISTYSNIFQQFMLIDISRLIHIDILRSILILYQSIRIDISCYECIDIASSICIVRHIDTIDRDISLRIDINPLIHIDMYRSRCIDINRSSYIEVNRSTCICIDLYKYISIDLYLYVSIGWLPRISSWVSRGRSVKHITQLPCNAVVDMHPRLNFVTTFSWKGFFLQTLIFV
jgi:hypothetical protein